MLNIAFEILLYWIGLAVFIAVLMTAAVQFANLCAAVTDWVRSILPKRG